MTSKILLFPAAERTSTVNKSVTPLAGLLMSWTKMHFEKPLAVLPSPEEEKETLRVLVEL